MPYRPDARPELEARLAELDPELQLLEPEDPDFNTFLGTVNSRNPTLASQINAAVADQDEQNARDLFGQSPRTGVQGLLAAGANKAKGKSVRGTKTIRPITLGLAAAGAIGALLLITALIPENKKAEVTTTAQTTSKTPTGIPTAPDTDTLPQSTQDTPEAVIPNGSTTSAAPTEPAPAPIQATEAAPTSTPTPTYEAPAYTPPAPITAAPTTTAPAQAVIPQPIRIASAPVTLTPRTAPVVSGQATAPVVAVPAPTAIVTPPAASRPATAFTSTSSAASSTPPARTALVRNGAGEGGTAPAARTAVVSSAPSTAPAREAIVQTAAATPTTPRTALQNTSVTPTAAAPATGLVSMSSAQERSETPPQALVMSRTSTAGEGAATPAAFYTSAAQDPAQTAALASTTTATAPEATPAPAPDPAPQALVTPRTNTGTYAPGTVLGATLETGVVVSAGATHPVWARATDGSLWRGTAALSPDGERVLLTFTAVLKDGTGTPQAVNAYVESPEGPGIGGKVRTVTKNAAQAALSTLANSVVGFVQSQSARTSAVTSTGIVTTSERPQNFWLALGGGLAKTFVLPDVQATSVRLGELAVGSPIKLRVDMNAGGNS